MPHAHPAAQDADHLAARLELLTREKALNRERDALAAARRALPPVPVTKAYRFTMADGETDLAGLFGPHGQLLVQHFMFGPDWDEGCKSCSFWTDGFDLAAPHLAACDTAFVTVARAPWQKLAAFRERMGWRGPWASSHGSDFNQDFGVSFDEGATGEAIYNYRAAGFPASEAPGISSFSRDGEGAIWYHYSTFARGLDPMNPVYQLLDLTAKGRDEGEGIMHWLKLRDEY